LGFNISRDNLMRGGQKDCIDKVLSEMRLGKVAANEDEVGGTC
jgi:BarA-like signal transduction histidine kinase